MFKKLRRKEKQLSKEETYNILENNTYGVLGTVGEDRYPYTVPMNYVIMDGKIYFHGAKQGHKIDNINYNNKASFCVVSESEVIESKFTSEYKSVIVFGKISIVDGKEKKDSLIELVEKYSPEYRDKGIKYIEEAIDKVQVFKLDIERMTGKGDNIDQNQ